MENDNKHELFKYSDLLYTKEAPQSQAKFQSKSQTFFHSLKNKKNKLYFLLSFRFFARKLGPLILMMVE